MSTTTRAREASADEGTPLAGDRRRKVLAILAGGLVLGVGAAVTLAAWNDSEFATGTFGAGAFDLQGSVDGTAYSSSPTEPGKTLAFELDADLLSPGATVYAPFGVHLSADSDYEAAIDLSTTAGGDIGAQLTYSVYEVGTFGATCSAATPPAGTALVADRAVSDTTAVSAFSLTAATTPVNLCFVVEAGAGLTSGQAGTVTWEFAGESGDPLP